VRISGFAVSKKVVMAAMFIARWSGSNSKVSFRSVIAAVPPINGLGVFIGQSVFYKYFVPTGLTEAKAKRSKGLVLFHTGHLIRASFSL